MIPANRVATHPGVILKKDYLEPLGISIEELAAHTRLSNELISGIIHQDVGVTPEVGWLFSEAFNTSPQFWLNLQSAHDLSIY